MGQVRPPCAIGFYPPEKNALKKAIEATFSDPQGVGTVPKVSAKRLEGLVAGIAPHAGFIYSGPVASHLYNLIAQEGFPETFILIGPKHGFLSFQGAVVMAEGLWETPLGKREIDTSLAQQLLKQSEDLGSKCILEDAEAHYGEHSLEVQLPFLQFLGQNHPFKIVPLVISSQNYSVCEKVAFISSFAFSPG